MARHQRLIAWQRARLLVLNVYTASSDWPTDERYGITAQARRAAVSVAANIAEGAARYGSAELNRFLGIAAGSLGELACLIDLARDLHYLTPEVHERLEAVMEETGRPLSGLRRSLRKARSSQA